MHDMATRAEARVTAASGNPEDRLHTFAVYGALALIAAVVFGTLSFHPF